MHKRKFLKEESLPIKRRILEKEKGKKRSKSKAKRWNFICQYKGMKSSIKKGWEIQDKWERPSERKVEMEITFSQ
jgi:hypothetical protein